MVCDLCVKIDQCMYWKRSVKETFMCQKRPTYEWKRSVKETEVKRWIKFRMMWHGVCFLCQKRPMHALEETYKGDLWKGPSCVKRDQCMHEKRPVEKKTSRGRSNTRNMTWCMLLVSKETNVCIERDVFKRPSCVKRDQFIYEKRPMENTDFKR